MLGIANCEWSYGRQWRSVTYAQSGNPVYDEGTSASSVYTLVSYPARTWAREAVAPLAAPAPATGLRGCLPVIAALPLLFQHRLPGIGFPAGSLPAAGVGSLRAAVTCGTLVEAGHQRVDGVDTIELKSRPGSPIAETVWVSPGTYLPVRVVIRSGPGGPAVEETADTTWLSPTAQNLAKLTVPVPAGFRKVQFLKALLPVVRESLRLLPVPVARCLAPDGPACTFKVFPRLPGPRVSGPVALPVELRPLPGAIGVQGCWGYDGSRSVSARRWAVSAGVVRRAVTR